MKRLLLLFIILSACHKEVHYYPSKNFFKENSPREIKVKDLNFGKLVDSLAYQLYRRKRNYISIIDNRKEYKISPFTYSGGLIKERNALEIEKDSIWWNTEKRSLSELTKLIELHYGNEGKEYFLPYSFKKAFIKLTLDGNTSSEVYNDKILYIIQSFEKANFKNKDSCNLNILIDKKVDLENQKIPPPPILKEIENE